MNLGAIFKLIKKRLKCYGKIFMDSYNKLKKKINYFIIKHYSQTHINMNLGASF